jgi:hypothetical protein
MHQTNRVDKLERIIYLAIKVPPPYLLAASYHFLLVQGEFARREFYKSGESGVSVNLVLNAP